MGFGGRAAVVLAATGKFTAVIYTIVEYPSTWKERGKRARNRRREGEEVIENRLRDAI